jgi:hypothetical protein
LVSITNVSIKNINVIININIFKLDGAYYIFVKLIFRRKRKMKKKLLVFGIIGIFLLTCLTTISTVGMKAGVVKKISKGNNEIVQQIISSSDSLKFGVDQDKRIISTGAAGLLGWFGFSVSLDEDVAIATVPLRYISTAHVFKLNGEKWIRQAKLTPNEFDPSNEFGWSVFVDNGYAIIGAPSEDNNTGSVYVFKQSGSTWTQQAKLTADNGTENDRFGSSVSLDGDTALIGAPSPSTLFDDETKPGSAYIFKRTGSTWTEQAKLTATNGAKNDWFGCSVSLDGDTALIGAKKDDNNGSGSGSAYVFKRDGDTWEQQTKLTASDGAAYDVFGHSVSLDGDTALIGAKDDYYNGQECGSAYVFKRTDSTWTQQAKLTADDGTSNDRFGCSVSLDNGYAIIGADCDGTGSVYVFKQSSSTWTQQAKLKPSDRDTAGGANFGCSVSLDGDTVLIGAMSDSENGVEAGSAYMFKRNGNTWIEQQELSTITAKSKSMIHHSFQIFIEKFPLLGQLFYVFTKLLN